MTINHIDQLTEWWTNADNDTVTHPGDTLIKKGRAGFDIFEVAHEDTAVHISALPNCRLLHRAPAPKPAWHDAVAVIASTDNLTRQVWERDGDGWYGTDGYRVDAEALEDVTPLIEAKVTDEMVERARKEAHSLARPVPVWIMRAALTAALGLETE